MLAPHIGFQLACEGGNTCSEVLHCKKELPRSSGGLNGLNWGKLKLGGEAECEWIQGSSNAEHESPSPRCMTSQRSHPKREAIPTNCPLLLMEGVGGYQTNQTSFPLSEQSGSTYLNQRCVYSERRSRECQPWRQGDRQGEELLQRGQIWTLLHVINWTGFWADQS